jgi:predicted RNase H-like HicB family nuclease
MPMARKKTPRRRTLKDTVYTYTVLFEPAAEGGYTVTVPALPGAITEGDTLEEARRRAREVIRGHLKV